MAKLEYKLSKEAVQEQLDAFFDWYNIDLEERLREHDQDEDSITPVLYPVKRAIRQGLLEFKEIDSPDTGSTFVIEQHLLRPVNGVSKLTFREVDGKARVAVKSGGDNSTQTYQFLAALCGEGMSTLMKLRAADLSAFEALGLLFLLV